MCVVDDTSETSMTVFVADRSSFFGMALIEVVLQSFEVKLHYTRTHVLPSVCKLTCDTNFANLIFTSLAYTSRTEQI